MTAAKPRARRKWIVDDLQYRLLFINVSYFVVGLLIVGTVVFVPLVFEMRDTNVPAIQRSLAASELLTLHRRFWPGILLALALLGLHSVLTSHRISGPLYRFRTVLRIAADGDLSSNVRVRRHDFLSAEADAINELLAAQRARYADLKSTHGRLAACAENLDGTGLVAGTRHDVISELRTELDTLNDHLSEVRLAREEGE